MSVTNTGTVLTTKKEQGRGRLRIGWEFEGAARFPALKIVLLLPQQGASSLIVEPNTINISIMANILLVFR
jgi:hypothetical protein